MYVRRTSVKTDFCQEDLYSKDKHMFLDKDCYVANNVYPVKKLA